MEGQETEYQQYQTTIHIPQDLGANNAYEQNLRQKCYELALRSISVSHDYSTQGIGGGYNSKPRTMVEPNYTKKAQEIYDYITEGKVAQ